MSVNPGFASWGAYMNKGLKKIQFNQFKAWVEQQRPNDHDMYDIQAIYDDKLTLEENKNAFMKFIKTNVEPDNDQYEEYVKEMYEKARIKPVDTKEYYREIYEAVEKAKMGFRCLIFIKGAGGTGKSYNIEMALKEHGMGYVVFNEVTQATLPKVLYENNDKVIWIKDVAKILNNPITLDIIKAACEMELDKDHKYLPRKISIQKFSNELRKAGVPSEFEFKGIIIFDYNALKHTNYLADYTALKQRGEFIEIAFSKEEMGNIMHKIASKPWEKEVTEYLLQNASKYRPLNLRIQQDAFIEYLYAKLKKQDWRVRVKDKVMYKLTSNQIFIRSLIGDKPVKRHELEAMVSRTDEFASLSDRTIRRRIDTMIRRNELHVVTGHNRNPMLQVKPKGDEE